MNHLLLLPITIPIAAPSEVALKAFVLRSPKGLPLILNHASCPWSTHWTYMIPPPVLHSLLDETSPCPLTSLKLLS